jgi:fructuronate reductase
MDGSQKVPYRFVETLRASPVRAVVEGLRAWIKFCTAQVRAGHALNDPKADEIAQAVRSNDPVKAMLELVDASDLLPFMRA